MDKAQGLYASAGYGEGYDLKVRYCTLSLSLLWLSLLVPAEHLLLGFRQRPTSSVGTGTSGWAFAKQVA